MLSLFPLLASYATLSIFISAVSAKICNPANFICSGKCPELPPNIHLLAGRPVCMKDLDTTACVCWRKEEPHHVYSWFRCEATINDTIAEISCQPPSQCFSPDDEPTCLVIPKCNCLFMEDITLPEFHFGSWRPVKALVETQDRSVKYPKDVREFSLKHLLFLLAFVIAPLACWCLLNLINENKCRRKNSNQESSVHHTRRHRVIDQNISSDVSVGLMRPTPAIFNVYSSRFTFRSIFCLPFQTHPGVALHLTIKNEEGPPTYDEAISHDCDAEGSPPPYADAVQGPEFQIQEMIQAIVTPQ